MDFDNSGSPGRFFTSLLRELKSIAMSNIEYFREGNQSHHAKFHAAFCMLFEYIDSAIEPYFRELSLRVHEFDASPNEKGNGYRSLLRVVQKCCMHLLQLSRLISTNKETMLFRRAFYMKELEAYVATLGQLRAFVYYALQLMNQSESGILIPYDKPADDAVTEQIMTDLEMLSLECFYGRCLGFQFCESMQRPLQVVSIAMASFGEGYQESSQLMKVATSLFNSGRYILNPDARARQISSVTRTAGIEFCKQFWSITESEIMHHEENPSDGLVCMFGGQQLPSMAGPAVQVDEVFQLGPDAFIMPTADGQEEVTITPPCAHTGPAPVQVRLISYQLREGQELKVKSNKSPNARHPVVRSERSRGLLVHVHGGGFVAQSSRSHEVYLRHWAKDLNVPILSIDYSLAPESPFPRALEECFYAYAWAVSNCEKLGSTGEVIVLAGDSAGGNLILSTAMRAASFNIRHPEALLCVYPCVLVQYTPSPARLLSLMDPLLPAGILARCLAAYAGVADELSSQLAASLTCHIESSAATLRLSSEESQGEEWVVINQDSAARTNTALASQDRLQKVLRSDSTDSEVEIFSRPKTSSAGSFTSMVSDATDRLVSYVGNYLPLPSKAFSFGGTNGDSSSSSVESVPLLTLEERVAGGSGFGSSTDESPPTPSFHTPQTSPGKGKALGSTPLAWDPLSSAGVDTGMMGICLEENNLGTVENNLGTVENNLGTVENNLSAAIDDGCESATEVDMTGNLVENDKPFAQGNDGSYQTPDDLIEQFPGFVTPASDFNAFFIVGCSSAVDAEMPSPIFSQADNDLADTGISVDKMMLSLDDSIIDTHTQTPRQSSNRDSGDCLKETNPLHIRDSLVSVGEYEETAAEGIRTKIEPTTKDHAVAKAKSDTHVGLSQGLADVLNTSSSVDAPAGMQLFGNFLQSSNSGTNLTLDTERRQHVHRLVSREGMQLPLQHTTSMTRSASQPVLGKPSLPHSSVHSVSPANFRRERHPAPSPVRAMRNNPIARNPYMSPLLAPDVLLQGLPHVCLVACHLDPLLDDSIMFTRRLRSLGMSVDLALLDDLPHGFLNFAMVSRDAKLASDFCMRKLRTLLKLDLEGSTGV